MDKLEYLNKPLGDFTILDVAVIAGAGYLATKGVKAIVKKIDEIQTARIIKKTIKD